MRLEMRLEYTDLTFRFPGGFASPGRFIIGPFYFQLHVSWLFTPVALR